MLSCAPLQTGDINLSDNDLKLYRIDGIDVFELPENFKNIALMCEVFRKINTITHDPVSEIKIVTTDEPKISASLDSQEFTEYDNFHNPEISKNIKGWLDALKSDIHEDDNNLIDSDSEPATRKERVRRNNGSNFPPQLSQLLEGVCLTDACLQVLKDYLEWRKENGYPVFTGVTEIGK